MVQISFKSILRRQLQHKNVMAGCGDTFCNFSYSRGRDQEDCTLKPALEKVNGTLSDN
jgi:hypothetical protein